MSVGQIMPVQNYDGNEGMGEPFGKVNRLKNVFQSDYETQLRDSRKNAYNRNMAATQPPETKRSSVARSGAPAQPAAAEQSVDPNTDKYFETTNHVQRFQHTRAIFAKMEQESRKEQQRQRPNFRRTSPTRGRTTSPTSPPARPTANNRKVTPPPSVPPKPRALSDSQRMNQVAEQHGSPERYGRSESVDSVSGRVRSSDIRHGMEEGQGDCSASPSAVSSLRWLRNRNDDGAPSVPQRRNSPEPRPNEHLQRYGPTSPERKTASDMNINQVGREEHPVPAYRARLGRNDAPTRYRSQEDIPSDNIPWRQKKPVPERVDNGYNGGVLLHKRRSREEKGLPTKEDIEASLSAADRYWRSSAAVEDEAPCMTESTHSSGSGEEMARSDSSHDLTTPQTPTSPEDTPIVTEVPRRQWSSLEGKPDLRGPRTSSPHHSPRNSFTESPRTSFTDSARHTQSPRSSRSDMEDLMDQPMPALRHSYATSQDSEESLSRSSSEASVKRNSVLEATPGGLPSYDTVTHNHKDDIPSITLDFHELAESSDSPRGSPRSPLSPRGPSGKQPSPNQSIDSMTPSEHDHMLREREHDEDTVESAAAAAAAEAFLREREEGDGHEEPEEMVVDPPEADDGLQLVNDIWSQYFEGVHRSKLDPVESSFKHNEDGSYVYEVEGLPDHDPDDANYPTAKPPSRIKFSSSPIKVYSTYSVDEYDRKNEDVDPMAASAEYELEKRVERMELFPVELIKGSEGLGLSIIGMGVGADAGLEKLGIFIKTLTDGGPAQKDARIQVNDQIIEVDGKSLVGVSQAYAASVLRNTSGTVKFLIGREKNPQNSEVARLIQQSIEQDKRRAEMRQRQLEDRQRETAEIEQRQRARREEERDIMGDSDYAAAAQNTQPPPMELESPSYEQLTSPEEETPSVEVFELQEDSGSDATPDMDPQALFIKLKEAQYRNAVSDAELAKLKARMILLENADGNKRHYEKMCEDMAQRLRESEKMLTATQKDLQAYQELMESSRAQYLTLEKQLREEHSALDKKYQKAKKLIKDHQQRERDLLQEREVTAQIQQEKDQQYNDLARQLKDRIIQLEAELGATLKKAGLPSTVTSDASIPRDVTLPQTQLPRMTEVRKLPSTDNLSEISSDSEVSSPDISPDRDVADTGSAVRLLTTKPLRSSSDLSPEQPVGRDDILNSVPETKLLDTSASKSRAQLAHSKALATRRPPTKQHASPGSTGEEDDDSEQPFAKHDSDSTVRKNHNRKSGIPRLLSQSGGAPRPTSLPNPPLAPPRAASPSPNDTGLESDHESAESDSAPSEDADSVTSYSLSETVSMSETADSDARDDQSDTSSISQTSYEPARPIFAGMSSEIPDSPGVEGREEESGGITLISRRPRGDSGGSGSGLSRLFKKGSGGSTDGGIMLISSRPLDTGGYTSRQDYGVESTASVNSIGMGVAMVGELDSDSRSQMYDFATATHTDVQGEGEANGAMPPTSPHRHPSQYQSSPVPEWTVQQVCHWLLAIGMDQYAPSFIQQHIDGQQLLALDSNKLKVLGINTKDKDVLKKRLKDLRTAIERERKQQEKEQRAREKMKQGATGGKKKKFNFGK